MPFAPKPSITELDDAVARLGLRPEEAVFSSLSSLLCPVTLDGRPAFLKVTNEPEELAGTRALKAWDGRGAVRVLARQGHAIVLERAGRPLRAVVTQDGAATQALCCVAERLHAHTPKDLAAFPTLRSWFASLFADTTPRFDRVRAIADQLLNDASRPVLLHGDLHHDNVLDGAGRGWLAIDPKGFVGPRAFDYCKSSPTGRRSKPSGASTRVCASCRLLPTSMLPTCCAGSPPELPCPACGIWKTMSRSSPRSPTRSQISPSHDSGTTAALAGQHATEHPLLRCSVDL